MTGPYSTTARNKSYAKAMSPDGRKSSSPGAADHKNDSPFKGQEWIRQEKAEKKVQDKQDSLDDAKTKIAKLLNDISDIREKAGEIDSAMGMSDWESRMARNALDNLKETCEEALAEASDNE